MTANEIIIAHLRAEVLIQQARKRALREYPFNTDFQLKAKVCERTEDFIKDTIILIQQ